MVKNETPLWAGKKLIHRPQMDSTNEEAKRAGKDGCEHGTVFWADTQTAGKGRRGRSWYSDSVGNLYFTILLRPVLTPEKASMLTLVMAYAVTKAIRCSTGLEAFIKWPNDIVVNGKKVCGILSEMKLTGTCMEYCVIGVGINVGPQTFEADIADKATALDLEAGTKTDREALLWEILTVFEEEYEKFLEQENLEFMLTDYNEWLINRERMVKVLEPRGEYEALAKGINTGGELIVELPDGKRQKVYAGEVSVRGLYGYV